MTKPQESSELVRSCLWRNLLRPGLERFELRRAPSGWVLRGTLLALADGGPAEAVYEVICDATWRTERGSVTLRDEAGERGLHFAADGPRWYAGGREVEAVRGCVDVDLGWSPSTNTLPIRRLRLPVGGASGPLEMAWVRFPELTLERLPQEYRRATDRVYRYVSRGGDFAADLQVDDEGVVVDYQGLWQRVAEAR